MSITCYTVSTTFFSCERKGVELVRSFFCAASALLEGMKENMLQNKIQTKELYQELFPLVQSLGYTVVDVQDAVVKRDRHVQVVIRNPRGNTSLDDCAAVSRLVQPRLTVLFDTRDIHLEVSSPGLSRSFKDVHEFTVFQEEQIRILIDEQWTEGVLRDFDGAQVTLDTENKTVSYAVESIRKAKLAGSLKEK